jgi:hypothetical protein
MKEIKEVKDLFTFQMTDATFETVEASIESLVAAYEPLRQFTPDEIKAAYNANTEDLLFVDEVIKKLPAIRAKNILVGDNITMGLMNKRKFVTQNKLTAVALRKLANKLDSGDTIAMSEVYNFAVAVHDAVANAVNQKTEGALTLYNDIAETKLRAVRAAGTRKKAENAKKKSEKAAIVAKKLADKEGK